MNLPNDDRIEALVRQQFDGPVPDAGFSERLMQRLPPRRQRRRRAWPLWAGALTGVIACWLSLQSSPVLQAGWRDWLGGEMSAAAITLLAALAGVSFLATWWATTESVDY
ncbi:MAG TPA: hypothetical protein VFN13_01870 [Rudaea sp.]|nr:hypothetical protein [Rudaea sp.]